MIADKITEIAERPAFSFLYDGKTSADLLPTWSQEQTSELLNAAQTRTLSVWTDPKTGLRVTWEAIRYADFPALEWLLHFENTGPADTPILETIQALDLTLEAPMEGPIPYWLHSTKGAPSDPTDFEPERLAVAPWSPRELDAGDGRSSNRCFPFFKIETGAGSCIVAIGWSGQWAARIETLESGRLRVRAGMERTHFRLHPGEKARSPRILLLFWEGETQESNVQFRRLIYQHYAAKRAGRDPLPVLFCNTCFTRGGGWLNECNAENQISLIQAYAPLGVEAIITDAGWFEGGWPEGAGNWTPRQDAYPQGMGPVAQAAKARDMIYGLWFEPERVMADTWLHRNHPEWLLSDGQERQKTFLANFGVPEFRDYFFDIVKELMSLPGLQVYRQDFNMSPLAYWRHNDAPDRQGLTEIRYIEGLYAYWDRIIAAWPDSLREECASGGRRIDLETIMRFHIHQDSDYWFQDDTDQCQVWGLSQYLPNNLFTTPINRMDDYSFHSTLATSLCLGWIADAPDFDRARAEALLGRYRALRPLLVGDWYPVLPYSRLETDWMAMQWHRPDRNAGMLLVFRRAASPYPLAELALRGLNPAATYELSFDVSGERRRASGAELLSGFAMTLPERRRSELIQYQGIESAL